MGTRWDGVLAEATEPQLHALASRAMTLVEYVEPRIRVTLHATRYPGVPSLWCVELAGVNRRGLLLARPTPELKTAIARAALPGEMEAHCRQSASLALGLLVAHVVGACDWVFHSDGLCQSAGLHVGADRLQSAEWSEGGSGYGRAAVTCIQRSLPQLTDIDEFLDVLCADDSVAHAWRLMDKRTALQAPVVLE